jgi:hypothetical protein
VSLFLAAIVLGDATRRDLQTSPICCMCCCSSPFHRNRRPLGVFQFFIQFRRCSFLIRACSQINEPPKISRRNPRRSCSQRHDSPSQAIDRREVDPRERVTECHRDNTEFFFLGPPRTAWPNHRLPVPLSRTARISDSMQRRRAEAGGSGAAGLRDLRPASCLRLEGLAKIAKKQYFMHLLLFWRM